MSAPNPQLESVLFDAESRVLRRVEAICTLHGIPVTRFFREALELYLIVYAARKAGQRVMIANRRGQVEQEIEWNDPKRKETL